MSTPPPSLTVLFRYLELHPDQMFVFEDEKACMTYDQDIGEVVYLIGEFDKGKDQKYNTYVAHTATEALMN